MKKNRNNKPILFISHVHEDALIAKKMKSWLDDKLAKSLDIFVSSDKSESLPAGTDWWDEIRSKLKASKIIIALITKRSINRSWIFFEIGGGYFQSIIILPLLIGINKDDIKSPLNQITYLDISNKIDFENFCSQILTRFDLKTNLFNEDILNELKNLDKEIHSKSQISLSANETLSKDKRNIVSDTDALNILESWMGKRSKSQNTEVMFFSQIDNELNFDSGTTKRLIVTAANRWHYEPVRQAEETILFKHIPPQIQRKNWLTDY
ncbi:MAG: toll/interleukin-1 receptor domain-containing protein [Ignavibacteriales bacterium]|nr:toll/interleukin-1 receptor domain-containing protein [Ignavibacteriales bacterium]